MRNSTVFIMNKAPIPVNAGKNQTPSRRARRYDDVGGFESFARVRHCGSNSADFSECIAYRLRQRLHPINYHKIA
jgi:hypothetical protein